MRPASPDEVLAAERGNVARARAALDAMRARARDMPTAGGDKLAVEALEIMRERRLRHLTDFVESPPFFGRMGFAGGDDPHLGKRNIALADGTQLVMDWRAPAASAFYRAGPRNRMGLDWRRRFGFAADGTLSGYEDEPLTVEPADSEFLRQEIERPRTGPMRDIVATIQPEQDELVRAPLDHSLVVQGAPGTGKTAVGLHRAAYLLYAYRDALARTGMLVVGPNTTFLMYIAGVLPALGEFDIVQRTPAQLVGDDGRGPAEDPESALLKGDVRMAAALRAAVADLLGPVDDTLLLEMDGRRVTLRHDELVSLRAGALEAGLAWQAGRERYAARLAATAQRRLEERGHSPDPAEVLRAVRAPHVRAFLDRCWPVPKPEALLRALYEDPSRLVGLDDAERERLRRPARSRWTSADRYLLDELAYLLRGGETYGHVVVDEAQDLSAMQCRAVGRRAGAGSLTALGDLAQATSPGAARSWREFSAWVGKEAEVAELTAGYRVPAEVVEVANRLLPYVGPRLAPTRALRASAGALAVVPTTPRELAGTLRRAVTDAAARPGATGVLVADAAVRQVTRVLDGVAGLLDDEGDYLRYPALVVPVSRVKGLEFDTVVLVEPADIVAGEARGLNRLYVALTRAVSALVVVHAKPLPEQLSA